MHISHLSLSNIRNYSRLEFAIPKGTTLLYGANAQGKTNILESIYYLATTRSPFTEHDSQLINWEATQQEEPIVVGRIKSQIFSDDYSNELEMRLIQESRPSSFKTQKSFRREVLINKRKVRLMDLIGNLRIVMFLPSDIQLITGSPAERRRFLNITLCQIDPIYCRTLSHYNKVLEQRNALLRQINEGLAQKELLPVYTEKLVEYGSHIFLKRATFIQYINQTAQNIHYESISNETETIQFIYQPRLKPKRPVDSLIELEGLQDWLMAHEGDESKLRNHFGKILNEHENHDIMRSTTTIGPHRDDWKIFLNQRPLAPFGSRGQQRSALLALKLAEIAWMKEQTNELPILLLDEVVAELDLSRRASLLETILQSNQAILTATELSMFSNSFLEQVNRFNIENGRILNPA
ncbi:MAG: DNA replication/repair protein RecF [Chloroflexota bacterium]